LLLLEHPSSATANITAAAAESTAAAEMPRPNVRRIAPVTLFLVSELKDFVFAI
jgi:hypothetical protein